MIWQMTYNHKLPELCSATLTKQATQSPHDSRGGSVEYDQSIICFYQKVKKELRLIILFSEQISMHE